MNCSIFASPKAEDKALLLHGEAYPVWIASKPEQPTCGADKILPKAGNRLARWAVVNAPGSGQSIHPVKGDFLLEARCTQVSASS